jgi:transposase
MLDWIPAQLRVIHTTRAKYGCRSCETVVQALRGIGSSRPQVPCAAVLQSPAPERVIAGGLATPALLAQVLVSKYCDHTPLYRPSHIFARHGVDLPGSTLAGWVGSACWSPTRFAIKRLTWQAAVPLVRPLIWPNNLYVYAVQVSHTTDRGSVRRVSGEYLA